VSVSRIPRSLREHIDTAFPANVFLVATVLPGGFAQVTPRGSTMVVDDEHLAVLIKVQRAEDLEGKPLELD
jgi:hypothetical protein